MSEQTMCPARVLLVTQVSDAAALAAACAMAKLQIQAFDSPAGAVASLAPGPSWRAEASAISRLLRSAPVLAIVKTGDQIACSRFTGGVEGDAVAPGVVLAGLPEVLTEVLTGEQQVEDLTTVSSHMSRWKAMKILAARRRR